MIHLLAEPLHHPALLVGRGSHRRGVGRDPCLDVDERGALGLLESGDLLLEVPLGAIEIVREAAQPLLEATGLKAGRDFVDSPEDRRRMKNSYTTVHYHQPSDQITPARPPTGAPPDLRLPARPSSAGAPRAAAPHLPMSNASTR